MIVEMVNELEIYCINKSRGCRWSGALGLFCVHEKDCEHIDPKMLLEYMKKKDSEIVELRRELEKKDHTIEVPYIFSLSLLNFFCHKLAKPFRTWKHNYSF
jgi:hypothetical protein